MRSPEVVGETMGCLVKDEADLRKVRLELEAGRLFCRQAGRECTFENTVCERRGTPVALFEIGAVRHQTAICDVGALFVYSGQRSVGGQRKYPPAPDGQSRIGANKHSRNPMGRERCKGCIKGVFRRGEGGYFPVFSVNAL